MDDVLFVGIYLSGFCLFFYVFVELYSNETFECLFGHASVCCALKSFIERFSGNFTAGLSPCAVPNIVTSDLVICIEIL